MPVVAGELPGRGEPSGGDPDGRSLVRLTQLMGLTSGVPDISVALIDGPVAVAHPDLAADNIRVLDSSGRGVCGPQASMACTHGTYIAGVLHAKRDGPVVGLCPGCGLLVRPIFSDAAVRNWGNLPRANAAELVGALQEVIEAGARVVNLSVGLTQPSLRAEPVLCAALDQAARRGVLVVAVAGNQGQLGGSPITSHSWVIPVVACDQHGIPLAQSNLGHAIGRNGVMAPGRDISTLSPTGGQAVFSGSSAAVPLVAGAAALLWSLFPTASASQIRWAVTGSLARRRSVTPPLLDAWVAYSALEAAGLAGVRPA